MTQDPSTIPTNIVEEGSDAEAAVPEGGTPGISEDDERIPAVLINDTPSSIEMLDMYPMNEVTKIAYVSADEAMGLSGDTRYGVIIMEVKDINNTLSTGNESLAKVLITGYCKPVEFYAPKYDTPQSEHKKDLRTTIAWEPSLRSDASGKAAMSFWSADRRNDYNVILEGITSEGELCRATYLLKAKE